MRFARISFVALLAFFAISGSTDAAEKVTYVDHVQPLLRSKCFACHNTDKRSGGLDMTSYLNLMQGGSSGEVLAAGDPSGSRLYALVSHAETPKMPPNSERVSDEFLKTLSDWITGGLLENTGSKPIASKPKTDVGLGEVSNTRPAGPAPLPPRLSRENHHVTPRTTAVTALASSPWAPLIAVAGQQQILLYNVSTLERLGSLPFPEGVPHILKFSRNGKLLLAGGGVDAESGRVVVYDVMSGERVIEVGDEYDIVLAADMSSDQSLIALGGPERIVRVFSTATGEEVYKISKHTDWIYSLEFSPDSVLLATGDRTGGLFVWEAATGREYLALNAHKGGITDVSWRADSNVLASSSEDGSVKLWEMIDGKAIRSINAHGGGTLSVDFTRDARLVTAGRDKLTKLWDQQGKTLRQFEAFGDLALETVVNDETDRVVSGDWTGEVRVWNSADGKRLGSLSTNPPPISAILDRLEADLAPLEKTQAESITILTRMETELQELMKRKANLEKTIQTQTALLAKTQTDFKTAQAELTELEAERTAKSAEQTTKKTVVTELTAAAAHLEAAAKTAPSSAPIKTALASTNSSLEATRKELATIETRLKALPAMMEAKKTAIATSQKQITDLTAAVQKAKAELAMVNMKLTEQTKTVGTAREQATQAQAAVASVTEQINRWKADLVFDAQVQTLASLREDQASRLSAVRRAESQLAFNEKKRSESLAEKTALEKVVSEANDLLATHNKNQMTTATALTQLGDQVDVAKTTLDKLSALKAEAEKTLPNPPTDPEAVAALDQLRKSVETQTGQLAALTKDQSELSARLKTYEEAIKKTTESKAKAQETLAEKIKELAGYQSAVADLKSQLAAAKQEADKGAEQLAQAKQELEALRTASGPETTPKPAG